MTRSTFSKAIKLADAYKVIGVEEIYLEEGPYPWDITTRCRLELGGGACFFQALHELTGLEFSWTLNLKPYNGTNNKRYEINVTGIKEALDNLNNEVKDQLVQCLSKVVITIEKNGQHMKEAAEEQFDDAKQIRQCLT